MKKSVALLVTLALALAVSTPAFAKSHKKHHVKKHHHAAKAHKAAPAEVAPAAAPAAAQPTQ